MPPVPYLPQYVPNLAVAVRPANGTAVPLDDGIALVAPGGNVVRRLSFGDASGAQNGLRK